jgi:ParB-like chromosome segregation protein Spo0J
MHEGKILDGRHRYRACLELGITPKFVELGGSDESKLEFVIDIFCQLL